MASYDQLPKGSSIVRSDDDVAPSYDTLPSGSQIVRSDDDSSTQSADANIPSGVKVGNNPWDEATRAAFRGPTDSHTLPGLAEIAATGVANIPSAAGNAAIDLGSRTFGFGTDNNHVIPEFSPGEAGKEVISDISNSDEGKAVARGAAKADQWVGNTFGATTQDVLHQAGSVAGDVANLIPGVGAAAKVAGPVVKWARDLPAGEGSVTPETPHAEVAETPTPAITGSRQSMGAAQVNPSPFSLTGQETARGAAFPQVKLAKNAGDVTADEQVTRAGIVKEIMNDAQEDSGIRTGVITGNEQTLRSEYLAAKRADRSPANTIMAEQIASEQRALPKFAQQRVDATGADPTLTDDYQRGEAMNGAFYGDGSLSDYLQQQKSKVYNAALEKNGASPIETPSTEAGFSDPQFQSGLKLAGHENVASGAQDLVKLAKTVGFRDPVTGTQYAPGSVAAYNAVTKAINRGWTPQNARTIATINGWINDDIAASGGGELYQLGSKIHALEKSLLSDSAGIKTTFGDVDPNGIQTKKPFDVVPKTLNNLPLDQWRHIDDTLDMLSRGQIRGAPSGMDPVPDALKATAARARAEMHGALAREVYRSGGGGAGEWISNAANETLNGRVGQKIRDTFPPNEVRKFKVLNAGGEMMPGRHPYEGSGLQHERLDENAGMIERYAPAVGAFLGAKGGNPWTVWGGEQLGQKIKNLTKSGREAAEAKNVSASLRHNLTLTDHGSPPAARASGGRVDHEVLVNRLMDRWHAARKNANLHTENLLNLPDEAITKALRVANSSAMP